MAALEGQRLVAELFPDSGSEPDFEGFHASEPAGNLSGGDEMVGMTREVAGGDRVRRGRDRQSQRPRERDRRQDGDDGW